MLIDHTNITKSRGLLLAVDYRKAFDTVRWDLIHLALELFGFGDFISKAVTLLFSDIKTCFQRRLLIRLLLSLQRYKTRMLLFSEPLCDHGRVVSHPGLQIGGHKRAHHLWTSSLHLSVCRRRHLLPLRFLRCGRSPEATWFICVHVWSPYQ